MVSRCSGDEERKHSESILVIAPIRHHKREAAIKKGLHLEIGSDFNPPEIGIRPRTGRTLSDQ